MTEERDGGKGTGEHSLKHRVQGRGLIQAKGHTALSHGCANLNLFLPHPHRYSSQSPTLHFLQIAEIHERMRLLGVRSDCECVESTKVSETMNVVRDGCGLLPRGNQGAELEDLGHT